MYSEQLTKSKSQPLVDKHHFHWYIFYTYPRSEKIVKKELEKRGYEVFLPVKKELKQWKNRQKKWIEEVLFPGYIFVHTEFSELFKIVSIPKVVTYIRCGETPSIIESKEIEGIKKMLSMDMDFSIETNFSVGQKVRVTYGPLAGHDGILVKQKGKTRFGIQLNAINHTVFIDISRSALESVESNVEKYTA